MAGEEAAPPALELDPREDLCELSFTGGATGVPRGVMLTHYNRHSSVLQGIPWFMKPLLKGISGKASVVLAIPMFHAMGGFIQQSAVGQGLRVIILADPRDMGIIRKLNFAIKHRDYWMPFAASILEEDAATYIKNPTGNAFYMIEAFDTMQPAGEAIVAGTHPFDKTVRPQIVNGLNGPYRDLIRLGTGSTYLGTPYYMSPDQISSKEVDGRSDIYSLGVVLFEMLTGQHLFDETDPLKVLFHHKETPPRRPSAVNPKIPPILEQIVMKMIAKKPEDRYQTVENLLVEIQEFMLKEGIENE